MRSGWMVGPISSFILAAITILLERIMEVVPARVAEVEYLWKKQWFGYCLITLGFLVCGWLHIHLPTAGWGATIMVVVGGLMALRGEMGGKEKWLWFMLLLVYAVLEIKAINQDRKDQNDKFLVIAGDLTKAVNSLDTTIKEGREHFDATMTGLSGTINTITGGESYAYLAFVPGQQFLAFLHKGNNPLYNVTARIADVDRPLSFSMGVAVSVGDMIPGHAMMKDIPPGMMSSQEYFNANVFFNARNGDWLELLRVTKVKGNWVRAIRVNGRFTSLKKEIPLCETIPANYPKDTKWKLDDFLPKTSTKLPSCE
jgi:hypothetical protein